MGQCYDGASVMSGKISGLNIQIKEKVPCAIYTHCLAQRLNIVLSNSVAENTNASNFFSIIQSLYVFITESAGRLEVFLDKQAENLHVKERLLLKNYVQQDGRAKLMLYLRLQKIPEF